MRTWYSDTHGDAPADNKGLPIKAAGSDFYLQLLNDLISFDKSAKYQLMPVRMTHTCQRRRQMKITQDE